MKEVAVAASELAFHYSIISFEITQESKNWTGEFMTEEDAENKKHQRNSKSHSEVKDDVFS